MGWQVLMNFRSGSNGVVGIFCGGLGLKVCFAADYLGEWREALGLSEIQRS